MGIVFDIIVIFIIVLSIYRGYRRGIADVGIKLFSIIVSLLVSVILCNPITSYVVDNTEIDEKIEKVIIDNLSAKNEKDSTESNSVSQLLQDYTKNIVQDTQNSLIQNASKSVAISVIKAGVTIVLFVLIRIIFIILQVFTDILTKIPVIKQCNEIGGIVYALLKALIIIYVILFAIFYISSISGNTDIINIIESTYITKLFYKIML